jgi:NAD(P)-dependent dehydrogenase (short-subunit alcohol dehydrogenase family)
MNDELRGRTCLVTGASSGIGLVAARELAREGASVVLVCRDGARGERALAEVRAASRHGEAELMLADLSSQEEVRRLARRFLATKRPLHVLLNNAGVVMLKRTPTVDGIETTLAVNHLAPFLLTNLLLGRMIESAPARIVNVASDAHRLKGVRMRFDDLQGEHEYKVVRIYGQSKLANILFTRELARRIEGTGVTANCLHPGMVATRLGGNNGLFARTVLVLLRPFSLKPEQGAETSVYLCASPDVERTNGKYFAAKKERRPSRAACDDEAASMLWDISEAMTGLSAVLDSREDRAWTT